MEILQKSENKFVEWLSHPVPRNLVQENKIRDMKVLPVPPSYNSSVHHSEDTEST